METVRGIVLPLMTPFTEDGELDENLALELTDFLIGAGVHAFFLLGSFGQGPVMRPDQRKRFAEIVFRHVRGRVPVVVHVGTAEVFSTVELGLHARELGCDAIAVVGPYYYSDHTEYEVLEHYKEMGKRVGMPTLIYNNPGYSGYDITPSMMMRIREQSPTVFGAKLSADSLEVALTYLAQLPREFSIFGLSTSLMPGALYGLKGTIIPPMMAYPELGVALWKALEERKLEEALTLQSRINELQNALRPLGKIYGRAVQCEAVRLRGFAVRRFPRWATKPISPEHRETLLRALRNAGLSTVAR